MSAQPTLQGGITFESVKAQDPERWDALPIEGKQEVGNAYFEANILPQIEARGYDPITKWKATQDTRNEFYSLHNLNGQPQGSLGDFLQGTAGEAIQQGTGGVIDQPEQTTQAGQWGSLAGGFLGGATNTATGAGIGGLLGGALGIPLAPFTGGASIPALATAGAGVGGFLGQPLATVGRDIRQQMDEGRPDINYGRSLAQGAFALGGQFIPGGKTIGGKILNTGLDALTNAGGEATSQLIDRGNVYDHMALARAGAMAVGGRAVSNAIEAKFPKQAQAPRPQSAYDTLMRMKAQAQQISNSATYKGKVIQRDLPKPLKVTVPKSSGLLGLGGKPEVIKNAILSRSQRDVNAKKLQKRLEGQISVIEKSQGITPQDTIAKQLGSYKKLHSIISAIGDNTNHKYTKKVVDYYKGDLEKKFSALKPVSAKKEYKKISKAGIDKAIEVGVKAKQAKGDLNAKFKTKLIDYSPETRQVINQGIQAQLKAIGDKNTIDNQKKAVRKSIVKTITTNIKENKKAKAIEDKVKLDKALKEEREKQKSETANKNVPKVLSDDEINQKVQELLALSKNKDLGTFSVKKGEISTASRTDYSKTGYVDKNRTKAVNLSYQEVINRYSKAKATLDAEANADKAIAKAEGKNVTPKSKLTSSQIDTAISKAKNKGFNWVSEEGQMRRVAQEASDKGEALIVKYQAEIAGESNIANYQYKYDSPLDVVGAEKDFELKSISNEGQTRARKFKSNKHKSKITGIIRTGEPAPYKLVNGNVVDVKSGEIIPQVTVQSIKSSEIKARLDALMTGLKTKNINVGDLHNLINDISDTDLETSLKSSGKSKEVYEAITGEPC